MNLLTPAAPAPIDIAQTVANSPGYWSTVLSRLLRDKVTLFFGFVLLLIVLMAIFAPLVAPADPYKASMLRRLKDIGFPGHPLGTDQTGRDMLSRLIYGGRLSLFMGVLPVLNALVIGGLLGVIAGYVGGAVNMAIMRTMDIFYAFRTGSTPMNNERRPP
jgi:peptide/nickel transport system permease protein